MVTLSMEKATKSGGFILEEIIGKNKVEENFTEITGEVFSRQKQLMPCVCVCRWEGCREWKCKRKLVPALQSSGTLGGTCVN